MEGDGRRVVRWGRVVSIGGDWDYIVRDEAVGAFGGSFACGDGRMRV